MPSVIDLDTGEELERVNTGGSKSSKAGKTSKSNTMSYIKDTAEIAANIYESLTPEQREAVNRGIYKVGKGIFYDAPKAIIGLFKKDKKVHKLTGPLVINPNAKGFLADKMRDYAKLVNAIMEIKQNQARPVPKPSPNPSPNYYPQDEILDESGWGGRAMFASPILV